MKRILSLILALLLCLGFIVSCEKEEVPSSSSSSSKESSSDMPSSSSEPSSSDESSSSTESSTIDNSQKQPQKEILDNVTYEYFDAYTAYLDYCWFNIEEEITIVSTYEDFLKYLMPSEEKLEGITEETFENSFVVLIKDESGHIREEDVYYNNFQRVENSYFLTYNLAFEKGRAFDQMMDPYIDICVIPRALCQDDIPNIELKIIWKEYKFEGEIYNSSCEVTTYLPE